MCTSREYLAALLRDSGFRDVGTPHLVDPLRLTRTAERVRYLRESASELHQTLAGPSPTERDESWQEIHTELSGFREPTASTAPANSSWPRALRQPATPLVPAHIEFTLVRTLPRPSRRLPARPRRQQEVLRARAPRVLIAGFVEWPSPARGAGVSPPCWRPPL